MSGFIYGRNPNADTLDGLDSAAFAILAGQAGGQTLQGGTAANEDLTLEGTAHATKATSYVLLQPNGGRVAIGSAGVEGQLSISSAHASARWGVLASNNTFNSVRDDVLSIGWNNDGSVPTEHALIMNFEANYKYDSGLPGVMEFIIQHNNPDTLTAYRPFQIVADRGSDLFTTFTNGLVYFGTSPGVPHTTVFEAGNWQFTKALEQSNVSTTNSNVVSAIFAGDNSGTGELVGFRASATKRDAVSGAVRGNQNIAVLWAQDANAQTNVLTGLSAYTQLYAAAGKTATVTAKLAAMQIDSPVFSGAGSFAVSNDQAGIDIANQGNAALTVSRAIKIQDQTGSSYPVGIESGKGYWSLGDYVNITGWRDVVQMTIKGHSTQNANLQEWKTSANAVVASVGNTGLLATIGAMQFAEMTAPGAGAANTARIYAKDNGSGKTQLMVQFATGGEIQIAIEA